MKKWTTKLSSIKSWPRRPVFAGLVALTAVVIGVSYLIMNRSAPVSCAKIMTIAKKSQESAQSTTDYKDIYQLMKNNLSCSTDKKNMDTSIQYTHLMLLSAVISENDRDAVELAADSNKWINENYSSSKTNKVITERIDILNLSKGNLPASFSEELNKLNQPDRK